MKTCPNCGHPIASDEIAANLPRIKRRIYEAIRDAGAAGIDTRALMDRVYGDDPNGGPSADCVKVHVFHLNRGILGAHGIAIRGIREHRQDPGMWRLVAL